MASSLAQLRLDDLGAPLHEVTFVAVDLETTGLSAARDRITEIGAVKVRGGELLGELRTFVHPGRPIPPGITALTGITDAMVRDAPTLAAVLPTVLRFLDGAVFVAHNASFDAGFLRTGCERHGHPPFDPTVIDTARLARRLLRDEVRNVKLATLAAHLHARTQPDHRALHDARATIDVLHGLLERAGTLGATTLEDLRALTRSSSDRSFRRRSMVADAPSTTGVYRFLDAREEVLYVGKATDLRSRLRTYFGQDPRRRIDDMVRETAHVVWDVTPTLLEAEVREVRLLHALRPRYNRRSTRPERAVHIALTREPFPRLSVVREPRSTHLATLGPLPSRRSATALVEALQDVLGLRPCTPRLHAAQDHGACILKELGRCAAPCDSSQSRDDYAHAVTTAIGAFADPSPVLAGLRSRMDAAAAAGRFERAAALRAALHTTAQACTAARDRALMAAPQELVAARRVGNDTEVVVLHAGALAATVVVPTGTATETDERLLAAAREAAARGMTGPAPSEHLAEERALLVRWLQGPGIRIVAATAPLATPVGGGRELARTVAEAHAVARRLRQDGQTLTGSKVLRRADEPTTVAMG